MNKVWNWRIINLFKIWNAKQIKLERTEKRNMYAELLFIAINCWTSTGCIYWHLSWNDDEDDDAPSVYSFTETAWYPINDTYGKLR